MALTRAQQAIVEKARALNTGHPAIALDEDECAYLVALIARDLGLAGQLAGVPQHLPELFDVDPLTRPRVGAPPFQATFERLLQLAPDGDTYFACIAKLHKSRLKYARILQTQPLPTLDQVGPRGLLQFGQMSARALTALLLWRKWLYDIDNRAAQETGYLFEPIIASAIGGTPVSAARSPIKRRSDPTKGRQADCIRNRQAYELKLRITIAASGQGRWGEEMDFPADCAASNYQPVLVVLDPTPNEKLRQLSEEFTAHGGEVFVGDAAWRHLDDAAGATMAVFLEKYVRAPTVALLREAPESPMGLAPLHIAIVGEAVQFTIGSESVTIHRETGFDDEDQPLPLPPDVDDSIPGP